MPFSALPRAALLCFLFCPLLLLACGDDDAVPVPDAGPGDASTTCTRDVDCSNDTFCDGVERCAPTSSAADARGCVPAAAPACDDGTMCDEAMGRCALPCGADADADGDGSSATACGGDDCDDTDATTFPGNPEVCDAAGHDEDCNDTTYGTRDDDRDGFIDAVCCNGATCGEDCNDARRNQHPLASEVCDRVDNDCDGMVDEGVSIDGFVDLDGDGHGSLAAPMTACAGAAHFSTLSDDCDDMRRDVHGAQVEVCDLVDNDCDGMVDDDARATLWYEDGDSDGFGTLYGDSRFTCSPPAGFSLLASDCDDTRVTVSPASQELCNALDDDCNGAADFALVGDDFEDDDGDGHADVMCPTPGDDCDDSSGSVFSGATEFCDMVDNDCDGEIDEGVTASDLYADLDGDGYGTGTPFVGCAAAGRLVPRNGDCNDRDAATSPGEPERCNGLDDDCDGTVDDGADARCALPAATSVCSSGSCAVATCTAGFADCDRSGANGCEAALSMDIANCGACGNDCVAAGATSCDRGACVPAGGLPPTLGGMLGFTPSNPAGQDFMVSIDGAFPATSVVTDPMSMFGFTSFAVGAYVLRVDPPSGVAPAAIRPTLTGIDSTTAFSANGLYLLFEESRVAGLLTQLGRTQDARNGIVVVYGAAGGASSYRTSVSITSASDAPVSWEADFSMWELRRSTIYANEPIVFTNVPAGPVTVITSGACYLATSPAALPVRPGMITVLRIGGCAAASLP